MMMMMNTTDTETTTAVIRFPPAKPSGELIFLLIANVEIILWEY